MSTNTFTLPQSDTEVPLTLTSDLNKDQLLSFPAFKTWISTLSHSLRTQRSKNHTFHDAPYKLRKVTIQAVDFFGGGRIGFIKLKAEVSNDNGEKLPGSVFLRGGSKWAFGRSTGLTNHVQQSDARSHYQPSFSFVYILSFYVTHSS